MHPDRHLRPVAWSGVRESMGELVRVAPGVADAGHVEAVEARVETHRAEVVLGAVQILGDVEPAVGAAFGGRGDRVRRVDQPGALLEDAVGQGLGLGERRPRLLLGPDIEPRVALDGQALICASPSVSSRCPG